MKLIWTYKSIELLQKYPEDERKKVWLKHTRQYKKYKFKNYCLSYWPMCLALVICSFNIVAANVSTLSIILINILILCIASMSSVLILNAKIVVFLEELE